MKELLSSSGEVSILKKNCNSDKNAKPVVFSKSNDSFKCTFFSVTGPPKKKKNAYTIQNNKYLFSLCLSWYMKVFLGHKNRLKTKSSDIFMEWTAY